MERYELVGNEADAYIPRLEEDLDLDEEFGERTDASLCVRCH